MNYVIHLCSPSNLQNSSSCFDEIDVEPLVKNYISDKMIIFKVGPNITELCMKTNTHHVASVDNHFFSSQMNQNKSENESKVVQIS